MRIKYSIRAILFCIALSFLTGCSTLPGLDYSRVWVSQGAPFVIANSRTEKGWGYLSHPRVVAFPDGMLVALYYLGGDSAKQQVSADLAKLGPAVSRDGGRTWALGEAEIPENRRKFFCNTWSGVLSAWGGTVYMDGDMLRYVGGLGHLMICRKDGRMEGPFMSPVDGPDADPVPCGVYMGSNTVLMAGRYAPKGGKSSFFLYRSSDGGHSFKEDQIIAGPNDAPWGNEGPNEGSMVRLDSSNLVAVMRTGQIQENPWVRPTSAASMLSARSIDGGKTWEKRRLPIPGVFPKLLLMSNGVLVCAFGRPGNNLMFSTDGGKTWGHEVALTAADGKTTGYVDIVEVAPNRLLAVYDMYNTDLGGIWLWEPHTVNGVLGRFVDVKRLW